MSRSYLGDNFNVAAALTAKANYAKIDDSALIPRDSVFRVLQDVYNNDLEAALLALNRLSHNEPRQHFPAGRVRIELELLLACQDSGKSLLDG